MVKDALHLLTLPFMRLICLSSGLTHKGSLREAGKTKETIAFQMRKDVIIINRIQFVIFALMFHNNSIYYFRI